MKKSKENVLLKKILSLFENLDRGKVLDLGAASGHYSVGLKEQGFDVIAADVTDRFRYADTIKYVKLEESSPLPFGDNEFDFVLMAEVIEHLRNPYAILRDISRVLKTGGGLILSTPNILNVKSRMRFLVEGSFEYFREPPLDHVAYNARHGIDVSQVHVVPYRFHELEFLLSENGFDVEKVDTSVYEGTWLKFLVPLIRLQLNSKEQRSLKKGGLDYRRINQYLLSPQLLLGRHLIVLARKQEK